MKSAWTRMLTNSRASRSIYGAFKAATFLYLGGAIALKSAATTYHIPAEFIAGSKFAGVVMATIAVPMCVIRGLPVLVDGWEYVKG